MRFAQGFHAAKNLKERFLNQKMFFHVKSTLIFQKRTFS